MRFVVHQLCSKYLDDSAAEYTTLHDCHKIETIGACKDSMQFKSSVDK